jgi:hypothetical protein
VLLDFSTPKSMLDEMVVHVGVAISGDFPNGQVFSWSLRNFMILLSGLHIVGSNVSQTERIGRIQLRFYEVTAAVKLYNAEATCQE